MKIQIEIRRPRWLPARLRWRTRLVLGMLVALIVAVPVAWANHDFSDVPNTPGAFHTEISAIKGAGITAGCGPGLYCPADSVRRDAMAAFIHRGFSRGALGSSSGGGALTTNFTDLSTTTIQSGGVAGGTGFVLVTASGSAYRTTGVSTENVRIAFRIIRDGGNASSEQWATLVGAGTGGAVNAVTAAPTWLYSVPTATTLTFRVQAEVAFGAVTGISSGPSMITATYLPFGSTGANTLGALGTAGTTGDPER